jgi:hypothetical protein
VTVFHEEAAKAKPGLDPYLMDRVRAAMPRALDAAVTTAWEAESEGVKRALELMELST